MKINNTTCGLCLFLIVALVLRGAAAAADTPKAVESEPTQPYVWKSVEIVGDVLVSRTILHPTEYDPFALDSGRANFWPASGAKGIKASSVALVVSPPSGAFLLSTLSTIGDGGGFRHEKLDESPASGFFKPGRGRNTGLDFAELNPSIVVRVFGTSGAFTGGAYSLDNGKTWADFATAAPVARDGVSTIAVSADGSAWVCMPDRDVDAHVTRDRGTTWKVCTGLAPFARIVSDRADPNRFYAFDRTTGTAWVSVDGGTSFSPGASGLPRTDAALRTTPGKPGEVWLPTEEGLFRSHDGAKTFTKVMPTSGGIVDASRLGFGKAAPGQDYPALYLFGTIDGKYGVYRSDNEGVDWVCVNDYAHQFAYLSSITGDPRVYGRVYVGSHSRGIFYGDIAP